MAVETMFIAAAVWLTGMLGFFMLLYYTSRDPIARKVWLTASFGTLFVSMGMLRKGYQNVVVITDLADLTSNVMHVMEVGIIFSVLLLAFSVLLDGVKRLRSAVEGKLYGKEETAN